MGTGGETAYQGQPKRGQDGRRGGLDEIARSGGKPTDKRNPPQPRTTPNGHTTLDGELKDPRAKQASSETLGTGGP